MRAGAPAQAIPVARLQELLSKRQREGARQPIDDAVLQRALAAAAVAGPSSSTAHRSPGVARHGPATGFDSVGSLLKLRDAENGRLLFQWAAHAELAASSTQYVATIATFQARARARTTRRA